MWKWEGGKCVVYNCASILTIDPSIKQPIIVVYVSVVVCGHHNQNVLKSM